MSKQPSPIVRAVFADLLVALSVVTLSATPGGTATTESCLAAPNSAAPDGSHWYFRTDRTTQRKCWYLAAQGHKVHRITRTEPADEEPAARPTRNKREAGQSSAIQAAAPQTPAPREDAQERMQRFILGGAPQAAVSVADATPQAAADAAPVPPAGNLPWPAVSQPAAGSNAAGDAAATAVAAVEPNDVARDSARDAATQSTSPNMASDASADTAPVTPLQMLLLFVAALAIAGSLLHTILKVALARRHRVYVDRREDNWSMDNAYERALPPHDFDAPMRAPSEALAAGARDPDAERLTQLLRDIERRAAA
jgi:hypothetical protein